MIKSIRLVWIYGILNFCGLFNAKSYIYIYIYIYLKNAASNIEQDLEPASHKAEALRLLTTHHENFPN